MFFIKKILLLDDNQLIADITKAMLIALLDKVEIKVFYSPVKALTSLALHKFDIIISDFEMPEMNGEEFFRKVLNNDF